MIKTKSEALEVLHYMVLSRHMDEKMLKLVKQNKGGTFQLGSSGHELIGVVAAHALEAGKDWSCPYYRDQPFVVALGCDIVELFGVFMGRATKNHSAGRMMPYHYSHRDLRIICQSSVVGSQLLHAVGKAWAIKNLGSDEVVYVSCGDGATSQGDFHEALNFAAIHALPVIFVVQNNGWAISVPAFEQSAGGSLIDVARGYSGLSVADIDGTDFEAVQKAMQGAVARGRAGKGPSLVMAHVPRLSAHSNSDDPSKYRSDQEERDPVISFETWIKEKGFASEEKIAEIHKAAKERVEAAVIEAEKIPFPPKGSGYQNVFADYTSPLSVQQEWDGEKITMMDALNHAISEEMEQDSYIVTFGQDVAHGK
ncbi:MAG: thiamine pyrophosphate-dependent enzyme, partial [Chlamydiales bacterium]